MHALFRAALILGVAMLGSLAGEGAPAPPPGERVTLTHGTLFIPQGTKAAVDGTDLVIHLKGQGTGAETNFLAMNRPGVLVWFWDPGLSTVYKNRFAEGKALQQMLDETSAQLKQRGLGEGTLRRVTVSSFSAGYGALRECLRQEALFKRIDALVLSDTVYAGFVGDAADRKVNPADMEPFVKFAREALAERKVMLIAHSADPVPTYASTTETANYLLEQVGVTRAPANEDWGDGLQLTSSAQKGKLWVFGFGTPADKGHVRFLKYIGKFYKRLP